MDFAEVVVKIIVVYFLGHGVYTDFSSKLVKSRCQSS